MLTAVAVETNKSDIFLFTILNQIRSDRERERLKERERERERETDREHTTFTKELTPFS